MINAIDRDSNEGEKRVKSIARAVGMGAAALAAAAIVGSGAAGAAPVMGHAECLKAGGHVRFTGQQRPDGMYQHDCTGLPGGQRTQYYAWTIYSG